MPNTPDQYRRTNRYASNNRKDMQTETQRFDMPPWQPMPYTGRRGAPGRMREDAMMCEMPLAMAWFEDQTFGDMYPPERGLERGTLFPELDKPWLARKGGR